MKRTLVIVVLGLTLGLAYAAPERPAAALARVDTSSPKRTLATFLAALNDYRRGLESDDDWLKGRLDDGLHCLNLSELPESQRELLGRSAAVYLKEVIDRLAVSDALEVPDAADAGRWQLAGSIVTLVRVAGGERAGEYLFSSECVRLAPALYRKVRGLPYLAGSGQGALYEQRLRQKEEQDFALRAVNLDNPRYTMRSFLSAMNDYREGVLKHDKRLMTRLSDAVNCLNLSDLQPVVQEEKGRQAAILLKETIDRSIEVDLTKVPIAGDDGQPLPRWRLKRTNITLQRVDSGERQGEYLFAKETVRLAEAFFQQVKDKPLLPQSGQGAGYAEPWLERVVPAWAQSRWLVFANWQWLGLTLAVLLGFLVKLLVQRLVRLGQRLTARTKGEWDDKILAATEHPLGFLGAGVFWYSAVRLLRFEGATLTVLTVTVQIVFSVAFIWTLYKLADVLTEYVGRFGALADRSSRGSQLLPLIRRGLRTLIVIFGVLVTAQNLGFNVMSLLAGLGLGGLAFALAAQDTCSNFFGSLMIVTDRPFRVGDAVEVGGITGTVEEIGFRSTRIRTADDSLVAIPNATVARSHVNNLGQRQARRQVTKLGLAYDTPPEKIEAFIAGIRRAIEGSARTRKDSIQVVFEGYGEASLNVLVVFFIATADQSVELVERHRIYLDILRLAAAQGLTLTFPTPLARAAAGGAA